jgi:hypothetical protein
LSKKENRAFSTKAILVLSKKNAKKMSGSRMEFFQITFSKQDLIYASRMEKASN